MGCVDFGNSKNAIKRKHDLYLTRAAQKAIFFISSQNRWCSPVRGDIVQPDFRATVGRHSSLRMLRPVGSSASSISVASACQSVFIFNFSEKCNQSGWRYNVFANEKYKVSDSFLDMKLITSREPSATRPCFFRDLSCDMACGALGSASAGIEFNDPAFGPTLRHCKSISSISLQFSTFLLRRWSINLSPADCHFCLSSNFSSKEQSTSYYFASR